MKLAFSKPLLVFFTIISTLFSAEAQIHNPVKWNFSVKNINESERELILEAKIDNGWYLYSQQLESDMGPIATNFTFEKNPNFSLIGRVAESTSIKKYDPIFEMNVNYFKGKAVFKQKIKANSKEKFTVKGVLEFQTCNDEMCLAPEEVEFAFVVEGTTEILAESALITPETLPTDTSAILVEKTSEILSENNDHIINSTKPPIAVKSFWAIFIAGFIGGFLALLTPCVFPMIPLTVSFFTKQSKTRAKGIANALIYGISIILIYVSIGFLVTKLLGPDALNELASNVWMNLAFFFIFIVFAISFLGAFEITLPASWVNKADAASDKGGLIGIFFMAFTLSLVSFSCTGPIIGTLLVEAAVGGNYMGPLIGMAGFSSALALPFALFAAFPGWLNTLPKSGGWLNSVKVVLGLLELALALKFLSNVDLAYHWGILTREIFIALWIIIFIVLGFYLLGKIKFSHDSDTTHVTIPRLFLSIITFAFVIYLVPGMWGAPLKLISGFPPPMFYSEGWNVGGNPNTFADEKSNVAGIDKSKCPHNLPCFKDYEKALHYAKNQGKPLLVDFTGWSCVNCRKMEDQVWIDPRVLRRLAQDYVLVSLYVDDKKELSEEEKYISPVTGKKIKTIGNKWSDLQTTRFKTNSQPYYVLLDHEENMLNEPTGYDPNIERFIDFLDNGKNEFQSREKIVPVSLKENLK
jgi:thiol:disulfide interchange protein